MAKTYLKRLAGGFMLPLALGVPLLEPRSPAVALEEHTMPLTRNFIDNRDGEQEIGIQRRMARFADVDPEASGSGPVKIVNTQVEYYTDVKVGNQTLQMVVDTGSSDTWFAKEGFRCLNPRAGCTFGKYYKGSFTNSTIDDQHLYIAYGSGNIYVQGTMGFSEITVSNITVPKQQVGLAMEGVWKGDSIVSGILGLGLPGLTASHPGGNWSQRRTWRDSPANAILYNPIVTSISKQVSPIFSLALSRTPGQSFLAFGGIPAGVKTTGEWATTPIVKLRGRASKEYLYYEISVDQMVWNGTQASSHGSDNKVPTVVVDSGTTLNLLPASIARQVNAAFNPPAQQTDDGMYVVRCTATPPSFGIQIGGKIVWTDPSSMILPQLRTGGGMCASGIGATGGRPYILGDAFMQGLVTVTDVDKMELRFAKRA